MSSEDKNTEEKLEVLDTISGVRKLILNCCRLDSVLFSLDGYPLECRQLTIEQHAKLSNISFKEKKDLTRLQIIATIYDPSSGKRVFSDEDYDLLGQMSFTSNSPYIVLLDSLRDTFDLQDKKNNSEITI